MSVNNNPFRYSISGPEKDIRCFSPNPRQCDQLRHGPGNYSAMVFNEGLRAGYNIFCFISKKARRVYVIFELRRISLRKIQNNAIFPEQVFRDHIDPFIGALSGQDRRNKQLKRVFMFQGTARFRICFEQRLQQRSHAPGRGLYRILGGGNSGLPWLNRLFLSRR